MSFTCNGVRSDSLAMAVSQARAIVLEGKGPAVVSNGKRDVHVWRRRHTGELTYGWVVVLNDMLAAEDQREFAIRVEQLLLDHG